MRDPNKLCPGCMNEWTNPNQPCPVCGFIRAQYEKPPRWLAPGHILNNKYMLGKVLGEGGFGVTYLGWDLNLQVRAAVKEYFPMGFATRESGSSGGYKITALPGSRLENFRAGLQKFMTEAQNLSKFYNLEGIVSVRDFFFENDTAYMVMEYIDGITLGTYLKEHGGRLAETEVLRLVRPVMDSLSIVHEVGIVHRDISPDNIMMTRDGHMKLIDFGAARFAGGDTERSLTIILKHGYAPAEQYQSHGRQGPWTDVYAMCATMYRMLTGKAPPSAMDRLHEDTLENFGALQVPVSERTAYNVIDKGLAIKAEDRWQSMQELTGSLYGTEKFNRERKTGVLPIVIGTAAVMACLCLGVFLGRDSTGLPGLPGTSQTELDMIEKTLKKLVPVSTQELADLQQSAQEAARTFCAGDYQLFSVREDGTVGASGANFHGNLSVNTWSGIHAVSAAKSHTVGLKSDGTAVAAGDTSEGKCALDTWKNLCAVAAGETHTLGLKTDGTVTAAGRNEDGQCGVWDWSDITAVAAGGRHSLALCADGTVLAAGDDTYGQCGVDSWKNVVSVAAKRNLSAGLRSDGTLVLAGDTAGLEDALTWQQVIAISLGDGYLAGLFSDHTVATAGSNAPVGVDAWKEVEAIAAASDTLFGKKADGSILRTASSVGSVGREELVELEKIVSGGGYLAGLKKDGTVVTWGASGKDFGQAGVSTWSNIKDIAACAGGVFGLTADGAVKYIGTGFEETASWKKVQQITAGDGIVLGLLADGNVAAAGEKAADAGLSEWNDLLGISVYANGDSLTLAGVKGDGSVISNLQRNSLPGENFRSVACGDGFAAAVLNDGTATADIYNNDDYSSLSSWKDVVSAAAGAQHIVGLQSDGSVLAAGSNTNGQCEVSGWTDIVSIAAGNYYTLALQSDGTLLIAGKLPGEF